MFKTIKIHYFNKVVDLTLRELSILIPLIILTILLGIYPISLFNVLDIYVFKLLLVFN